MKYQLEALVRSRLHRTGFSSTPRSGGRPVRCTDRKSTRLNSSHGYISYAVFCLKKKNTIRNTAPCPGDLKKSIAVRDAYSGYACLHVTSFNLLSDKILLNTCMYMEQPL